MIAFAPLHSPEFFAIISNDVEVGVYAAAEMVQRAMVDVRGWALQEYEGGWIEVVDEEWRVLQVDGEQVGQNGGQDGREWYLSDVPPNSNHLREARCISRLEHTSGYGQSGRCRNSLQVSIIVLCRLYPGSYIV